jgi:hypothetical protein
VTCCLVALLARLLPSRGRHSGPPAVAVPEPAPDAEDEGASPADYTVFDFPPRMARPYVRPHDDEAGQ